MFLIIFRNGGFSHTRNERRPKKTVSHDVESCYHWNHLPNDLRYDNKCDWCDHRGFCILTTCGKSYVRLLGLLFHESRLGDAGWKFLQIYRGFVDFMKKVRRDKNLGSYFYEPFSWVIEVRISGHETKYWCFGLFDLSSWNLEGKRNFSWGVFIPCF